MNALRLALAAAAGLLALGTPASAESVCLDQAPAYKGCTIVYFSDGHHCVTGYGTVAGQAYRLTPCR